MTTVTNLNQLWLVFYRPIHLQCQHSYTLRGEDHVAMIEEAFQRLQAVRAGAQLIFQAHGALLSVVNSLNKRREAFLHPGGVHLWWTRMSVCGAFWLIY